MIQKLSYEYDLVGNVKVLQNGILVATNTALPAGPVKQKYDYDDLYQLVDAQGWYSFGPGKENNYTNTISYDTIGNMTQKAQINKIIQPSTTATLPKETNYVLNYVYGSAKPHAVTDAGDKLYSYDANGNMTGWTSKTSGQKRTIIWNEENRVQEIDDNGKATYFLYDDSGERIVKRGQHGETIYANRFYAIRNGELGTKSVYAGETRVLSKLVKTPNTVISNTTGTVPGSNGLNNGVGKKTGIIKRLTDTTTSSGVNPPVEKVEFFYHGDHLGSSNMITDSYGAVYQHLEYFPYGETWVEEGGSNGNTPGYKFTGKELDPETGLYYYGARYYDAVLSKWVSADPIDRFNAQSPPLGLNLYQYGLNNPVRFVDPTGREEEESGWGKAIANWFKEQNKKVSESTNRQIEQGIGDPNVSKEQRAADDTRIEQDAQGREKAYKELNEAPTVQAGKFVAENYAGGKAIGFVSRILVKIKSFLTTSKKISSGAENVADAVQLKKALASEQQMGEIGEVIAGSGSEAVFRDAQRVATQYGGEAGDWVKMSSSSYAAPDATKFATHWVENIKTGQRVEFKTKLAE